MDGAWELGQSVAARALPGSARPGSAWVVATAIYSLQRCKQWSSLSQTDCVAVCSDLENNHLVGTIPVSVASLTALEILYARHSFESTSPSTQRTLIVSNSVSLLCSSLCSHSLYSSPYSAPLGVPRVALSRCVLLPFGLTLLCLSAFVARCPIPVCRPC